MKTLILSIALLLISVTLIASYNAFMKSEYYTSAVLTVIWYLSFSTWISQVIGRSRKANL